MKRKKKFVKNLDVAIVSHKSMPNPITDNLKIFLNENFNLNLLSITHPLLEIEESFKDSSEFEYLEKEKTILRRKAFHWILPVPLLYLKDFFYTFIWSLSFRNKWDLYFGVGNLNPLTGFILRFFKKVDKVIYYSMDYYPTRFEKKLLNWLYFHLDKFCVRFSDETWNVSPVMVEAREKKMGMDRRIYNRQYTVPGGIWFNKVKRLPFSKINKRKIVYRGYLIPHMGVDLAIEAMPKILKYDPKIIFEIVGGGEQEDDLKELAKKIGVANNVIFHGWVIDRTNLEKILSDGVVGIATFNTNILDEKVKNADPGKIKDYMVMGMPIIVTRAISYYEQLEKQKCGIVIDYDPDQFAQAVIKLLTNDNLLKKYRENALKFIKNYDWNYLLKPNIERILSDKK